MIRLRALTLVLATLLAMTAIRDARAQQAPASPSPASTPSSVTPSTPPETATQDSADQSTTQDDESFADKAQAWAKRTQIIERLEGDVDGWYPRLGGMIRGSGFNLGPGYRMHLFDTEILADVSAGISIRNYKAIDARIRWMQAWKERVELWTDYRYVDFPQEDYYGLGPDARLEDRTSYLYDANSAQARVLARLRSWLEVGATTGLLFPGVGHGRDQRFPSTEQLFTDAEAPGLHVQPNYLHAGLFMDVDYRDAPGNPTSGGVYHVAFSAWDDRANAGYDFRRFDVNLMQHVPLTRDHRHVVSGRLGTAFVNNEPGDRVPFYFLPYVGGTDTVRSLREFRYKDENAIWFSAEYRYIPIKWVSAAAFMDWGNVSHDWQDIASDLKRGYGFGIRVHTRTQTFARFDFGFGAGEGLRLFMRLGPSF